MLIENALSDAVRFFHMDALSSAVGLKVDFDMSLLVIASGLYRLLARTMRGYADAQARLIFRDLIDMPASVEVSTTAVQVHFHRRAHLPIVSASGLLNTSVKVAWWNHLPLATVDCLTSAPYGRFIRTPWLGSQQLSAFHYWASAA